MSQTPGTTPPPNTPPDAAACGPYLWDRSLPVDAEVERLEKALEPLRVRGEFAGVEKVARARRVVIVRRASLSLAAMLLIGIGVGWWWTGRPVTDSGELSPWKFVAERGVRVTRTPGQGLVNPTGGNLVSPTVTVATNSRTTFELRTVHGSVVKLGPSSQVSFREGVRGFAPLVGPSVKVERGDVVAECASADTWVEVNAVLLRPGCAFAISSAGTEQESGVVVRGEATATLLVMSKSPASQRLLAPMRLGFDRNGGKYIALATRAEASPEFLQAVDSLTSLSASQTAAGIRASEVQTVLSQASPQDVGTLWNLAFSSHWVDDDERSRIVSRIGELLGRWPAAIKSSKEPPWSQTFAEDWWTIIRESAAANPGKDGESKAAPPADDAEAMKKIKDEAEKRAAERLKQQELEKMQGKDDGGKKVSPPPTPPPTPPDPKRRK